MFFMATSLYEKKNQLLISGNEKNNYAPLKSTRSWWSTMKLKYFGFDVSISILRDKIEQFSTRPF